MRAPRTLNVYHVPKDDSSSIQYPQIKIPARDFRLKVGGHCIQSFQSKSSSRQGEHVISAHTFCSVCGVHLLNAKKSSNFIYLNALTVKKGSFVENVVLSFDDNEGYPVAEELSFQHKETDTTIETKTSTQTPLSDDFIDPPSMRLRSIHVSPPSSPISEHSAEQIRTPVKQQMSSMSTSSTIQLIDTECETDFDQFESRSIKSAMSSKSFMNRRSSSSNSRAYFSSSGSVSSNRHRVANSNGSRSNNARINTFEVSQQYPSSSGSVRSLRPYDIDAGLAQMDAQSVASSITENMFSTSQALESSSVFSRTSSHVSHRSVEQSHGQLRMYLSKHVTPRNASKSTTGEAGSEVGDIISSSSPRFYDGALEAVTQLELQQSSSIDL